MRFVCCLFHLNHNFHCRAGGEGGGEFLNSASNTDSLIMFRAASQRVNFSWTQSSDQPETSLRVTREVIHSAPLRFSRNPRFQARITSLHRWSDALLVPQKGGWGSRELKRGPALTLMVWMCSFAPVSWNWRWLDEAPCVSAHRDGLVFLSSQRLFCCAEEIPASQAPFNRIGIHSQREAPLGFLHQAPYEKDPGYSSQRNARKASEWFKTTGCGYCSFNFQ